MVLGADFLGSAGGKRVRGLGEYFMAYYTIWLVLVKGNFVPFWELEGASASDPIVILIPFGAFPLIRVD